MNTLINKRAVRKSIKEHVHRLPSAGKTIRCLLPVIVVFGLTGCGDKGPDMGPVGAGLSVIGLGIVIGATIIALLGKRGGGDE